MRKLAILLLCTILTGCGSAPAAEPVDADNIKAGQSETNEKQMRVSFYGAGDNLIHNCIYWQADTNADGDDFDFTHMYQQVAEDIKNADIAYINQETILGGTELSLSSYPLFNSPKELGRDMLNLGFDVFSHATNHVFDKGEKGVANTYNFYNDKNAVMVGIHKKGDDNIGFMEKNGIRFAFLNYTYHTNGLSLAKNSGYYVPLANKDKMIDDIKRAKDKADFIVLFVHWGNENQTTPTAQQKEDAKAFADAGCNAIIGTHPHSIQPIEFIEDTLVVYSLGNYISAQKNHVNLVGGTVKFDFVLKGDVKKIENVKFIPVVNQYESGFANIRIIPFDKYTPELAKSHGAGITYEYIQNLIDKVTRESNY